MRMNLPPLLPGPHLNLQSMESKEWTRVIDGQAYLTSTSRDLIPHEFVQNAFETTEMYWARPTSATNMKKLLDNSCTLGLYKVQDDTGTQAKHTPVGMARMITDYVTFAYLTDVYVLKEYRELGLGKWMIECCKEMVEEYSDLRWMMLLTSSAHAERMYKRDLGMVVLGRREDGMTTMGARIEHLQAAKADDGQGE